MHRSVGGSAIVGCSFCFAEGEASGINRIYQLYHEATDYNIERPHSALGYETPADDARTLTTAIARRAARDENSARREIAQPAPIGVNTNRTPVAAA